MTRRAPLTEAEKAQRAHYFTRLAAQWPSVPVLAAIARKYGAKT